MLSQVAIWKKEVSLSATTLVQQFDKDIKKTENALNEIIAFDELLSRMTINDARHGLSLQG